MKDIAGASKKVKEMVRENIRLAEEEGRFNDDVQPVDWEGMQKVTADFVYLPKNPVKVIWSWIARGLAFVLAKPLCFFGLGSAKIKGRKNFKGIKAAVVTCNHVHIFDTFFVRAAAAGHKLYITVAEFNNMKGPLGALLRGAGCIPFSDNFGAMKNLTKTVSYLLKKKKFVLFYPEKAMWPRYEKPRPFIEGAFHAAVTNNVPVVPTFIMFKNPTGVKKIFRRKKIGVLHVLPPVYPREDLSKKENIEYMKNTVYEMLKKLYAENKD
ncbi:MAG: 1-acyl-sn-glycerol-3-phosphate acyltransferase [Treponema sp.]|nr:1-acyl-sn-glycerol-3-phosphate acyltransferase [Candidatus Treponema merdequi]